MSPKEKQEKLQLLRDFLDKQDVPKSYYSIGKYCDEAVCIEDVEDGWVVYEGDRGGRYNEKHFGDFYEAGNYLLSRATYNQNHREYLLSSFERYYKKGTMNEKKDNRFLLNFFRHPLAAAVLGSFIGVLMTSYITATMVERSTVDILARRLEFVEEKDTLEEAIDKINRDLDEMNTSIDEQAKQLEEKDRQITLLTEKLNDDSEIKRLNGQIEEMQQEKNKLQEERDTLQANYDELLASGYTEFIKSKQSLPISLGTIEFLNNEGVRTNNSGSSSVGGETFTYYIDTDNDKTAYIEYNLDKKYSEFKGKAYISRWAYENLDASASVIRNASISIQVKYNNEDEYQEIDSISGLSVDSAPVEIGGSLIGVVRLKIVFRGGGTSANGYYEGIIHLGEPVLYKAAIE